MPNEAFCEFSAYGVISLAAALYDQAQRGCGTDSGRASVLGLSVRVKDISGFTSRRAALLASVREIRKSGMPFRAHAYCIGVRWFAYVGSFEREGRMRSFVMDRHGNTYRVTDVMERTQQRREERRKIVNAKKSSAH